MASMSYEMRKADRLRKRSGSVDSQERDELHHDDDRGHRRHREKHRKRRKYRSPNNKVHDSSEDCPHKEVYDNPSYRHSESRRARRGLKHSDDENQKERRQRREPVQEVLVVQHEEENLGAGLGILEHKSEQQWNTDVSSFMKENKIKQRNGPDKQVDADSYGEIEFIGFGQHNKKSPYVRVDMETEPHILWDLLINQWKMDKPKVLISVTGGAQDFFFKDRLKLLFNKGLFKAAVSTGAWIITGGTAVGVMKKVGEAIMEESQGITSDNQKQVVALGIATWTMIDNKKALEGRPGGGGLWPAQYKESDLGKEKKSALDSNHTHFILVDHGKETFGADIRLRANLEKYIAEKTERETVHIPVVLVVVEGGYGTFQTVYESLVREGNEQSVPVVVVDGSGRAADVIALCLRKTKDVSKENLKKTYRKNLEKNMKESIQNFVRLKDDQMKQTLDWLAVIMTHRNMITVFQMQEANFKDIDRAILHGLLQAELLSADIKMQLNLALTWNRCDIAREEIITAERRHDWQKADLEESMMTALIQNQVSFVKLYMEHVIHLDKFLTISNLHRLYKECIFSDAPIDGRTSTRDILKSKLENIPHKNQNQQEHLLCLVGLMCKALMRDEYDVLYQDDKFIVRNSKECKVNVDEKRQQTNEDEIYFKHPEQHLYLWALLLNRQDMALLFWKRSCIGNIGAALIGGRILKTLAEHAEMEEELTLFSNLSHHANEFEDLAIGVLDICYETDKKMAKLALVRKLIEWGDTTCLDIAYAAEQMKFMEHDCCQTKLQRVWKGNTQIHTLGQWALFFSAMIFPFLIPKMTFLIKDYKEVLSVENNQKQLHSNQVKTSFGEKMKNLFCRWKSEFPNTGYETRRIGGQLDDVTFWEGIGYYYKAPITKFLWNIYSYITLLVLFSWFILTDLRPSNEENSPGTVEKIVMGWVGTLIIEELRQIGVRDPKSLKYKIKSWASEAWNIFDCIMFLWYILSVTLRFTLYDEAFEIARICYCISLMTFYFRLLHMGFVQKDIGPKIIMITKMLKDLVYFVVILVIFILSFGIATEAILYPNMEPQIYVIFKSLYKPYWQLYGELFLEEVECLIDNETCHTDPRYLDTCPDVPDNIRWVAPTLTAIYMLISNILLINLLIAMFSYTFQKVQDNSETIWRFYRYELISEYHDRPTLAPPLIIINHGYRMARYLYHQINLKVELNEIENMHNKKKEEKDKKKTEIKNKFDRDQSHTLRVCLDERLEDYLNSFERKCMGNYFIKINQEYVQSWESTVSSTGERLVKVMHEVEEMKESFYDSKNVQQDGRGDRKDVQQDGRGDRKDVQQDGRSDRKDVQQDGRGDSKDVQQDGRGESKDVQQDRRGDSKDPQMSFVSHQMGQMNDRIGGLELKMGKIETDMKKMLQILEGNSQALLP